MRLLVSVRSAAEVAPAVAGGAEIIDAKEPSRGSLGPVSPAVLAAIAAALPDELPLSIALGDPASAAAAAVAVSTALEAAGPRTGGTYLKLGLAAVGSAPAARQLVETAAQVAGASPSRVSVVAVAYADHEAAGAPARDLVSRLAADAGAQGVLLDTWRKDGRDLFRHVDSGTLREWVAASRRLGVLVALAGSLDVDGVRAAARLPADVVGVRGAACAGGREGVVLEERVRVLRRVLGEAGTMGLATVQGSRSHPMSS
jgi:(5-formylfuran-3-yl)methyl phosphate synthase